MLDIVISGCLLEGNRLDAHIATSRQIGEHLAQGHLGLAFQPAGRLGRALLAFERTAAFLGRWLRRGRVAFFGAPQLLMTFDRRRIAGDMTDQPIGMGLTDQGFVHTRGQFTLGEFGEGARERRFAGNLGRARPATKTPKRLVGLDALYQHPRVRQVQNRFGDEGSGQRGPLGQRTSGKPMQVRDESLEPRHIHDRNQRLVRFGQATHRFLKIYLTQ